jgi:hypothetical protein
MDHRETTETAEKCGPTSDPHRGRKWSCGCMFELGRLGFALRNTVGARSYVDGPGQGHAEQVEPRKTQNAVVADLAWPA